jgi:hypothetical protein
VCIDGVAHWQLSRCSEGEGEGNLNVRERGLEGLKASKAKRLNIKLFDLRYALAFFPFFSLFGFECT